MRRDMRTALLVALAFGLVAACGGATQQSTAEHDDEGSEAGGACPVVDAGLGNNGDGPGQSLAQGTAKGESLDCTLCTLGALVIASPGNTEISVLPNARLQESSWASAIASVGTCTAPSSYAYLDLAGGVNITAATPGTYRSDGPASACTENSSADVLTLSYYPAGTVIPDCKGMSGPDCPDGCLSSCGIDSSGEFCGSCAPSIDVNPTEYALFTGCTDGAPTYGSWSATVTSVVPAPVLADSGFGPMEREYTAHGTLTATLVKQDGSNEPVTVSLTF